jgi:hypothetical protein
MSSRLRVLCFTIAVHITSAHVHVESSEMTMDLGSVSQCDRPNSDVFQGSGWCCWYAMLYGNAIDFVSISEGTRAFTVVADFVFLIDGSHVRSTPSENGQSQAKARDRSSFNLHIKPIPLHSLTATTTPTSSLNLHTKPHQASTLSQLRLQPQPKPKPLTKTLHHTTPHSKATNNSTKTTNQRHQNAILRRKPNRRQHSTLHYSRKELAQRPLGRRIPVPPSLSTQNLRRGRQGGRPPHCQSIHGSRQGERPRTVTGEASYERRRARLIGVGLLFGDGMFDQMELS